MGGCDVVVLGRVLVVVVAGSVVVVAGAEVVVTGAVVVVVAGAVVVVTGAVVVVVVWAEALAPSSPKLSGTRRCRRSGWRSVWEPSEAWVAAYGDRSPPRRAVVRGQPVDLGCPRGSCHARRPISAQAGPSLGVPG